MKKVFKKVVESKEGSYLIEGVEEQKATPKTHNEMIEHLFLEGENTIALKKLQKKYKNKVDVIYIDPPYDTGKEFIYSDNLSHRGGNWREFIKKRINLSLPLLTKGGVIFVSINAKKQAELYNILKEVFGESGYITTFIWNKGGGSSLSKSHRDTVEYIHCFSTNAEKVEFISKEVRAGDSSLYNSPNKKAPLKFKKGEIYFPNLKEGEIKKEDYEKGFLNKDFKVKNHINDRQVVITDNWKWTQNYLEEQLKLGTTILSKTNNLRLRYQKNTNSKLRPPTLLPSEKVGYTISGQRELKQMGIHGFDYPKPLKLLKYLLHFSTYKNKEALVLDFFAGSGTTGQAVMELNKEDNGERRFILCTNNENKIAEKITLPRLSRVIGGYHNSSGEWEEGLKENSLTHIKVEKSL